MIPGAVLRPLAWALVVFFLVAIPVAAQAPESAESSASEVTYWDFFVKKGGPIGFALIVLSLVTLALAFSHFRTIRRINIVPAETARDIQSLIDQQKYLDAIHFTKTEASMLSHVVHAALLQANNGFDAMERAIAETLEERTAKLFRSTEYLNIIGNVSPMIGLLGTVTGMILLFAEIHAADTFPGARVVADRIAIALITTFWGLAVAIPALSIYAIFRNRIDVLASECALAAEQIVAVFKPGGEAPPENVPQASDKPASSSPPATTRSPPAEKA